VKSLFSLSLIFLISIAWAQEASWKVVKKGADFFIHSPEGKSFVIQSVGGKPHFIKAESYEKDYLRVIYYAGSAGTSSPVIVSRALLFKKSPLKFLGDFPFSYEKGKGAKEDPEQPIWKVKSKTLTVTDPSTDEEKTIKLR
jgi:hypothetical protein